ncbi:hypothetical protein [Dinghuibacter silviterrae]|uniref:Uncharacterized protein n=1 Tax=Dinghuibacter silviterrae TaxID=1539049 RepID=A0A4R8DP77_9BACT|nr:hypothetical protein [Dinghuibacter silviterrae]TDW99224.1 hypothetical protein EDB95_0233 [Dinghuibacter silviterrae]
MEVHYHPHMPKGEKKPFREYLLEFLMIFLAVTMGFVAENIREAIHERHIEHEYMASLVSDLQADTQKLSLYTDTLRSAYDGLGTLATQCYLPKGKMETARMYYAYHHFCRNWYDLKLYDKTLVQLKSSGNLRLIPAAVADSLAGLDDQIQFFNDRMAFFLEAQTKVVDEGLAFFDYAVYVKANTRPDGSLNLHDEGFLHLERNPPLLSYDPPALKRFAGRIGIFRNLAGLRLEGMQACKTMLSRNIAFLQKAYHLTE